jgi:phosphate starvation-inducible PhoH-like protein
MANKIISLTFPKNDLLLQLLGAQDNNINTIEKSLRVSIAARGNTVSITGEDEAVDIAKVILEELYTKIYKGKPIEQKDLNHIINKIIYASQPELSARSVIDRSSAGNDLIIKTRKRNIVPYSSNQLLYINSIKQNDVVFAQGPAGTGKTYLAVALAVSMLIEHNIDRIILSRPAVEAGEKIGFLPGSIDDKIAPYLRPLYDALHEMLPDDVLSKYIDSGVIEIAPLAFMRGRTFNNAFIILDEAQNTTPIQMKMLLTRLGDSAKIVVCGDSSQVDLPHNITSGLSDAIKRLADISGISMITFGKGDIIRHPLTAKILDAYEKVGH